MLALCERGYRLKAHSGHSVSCLDETYIKVVIPVHISSKGFIAIAKDIALVKTKKICTVCIPYPFHHFIGIILTFEEANIFRLR